MNTDETARELSKVLIKSSLEILECVIEQRAYLIIKETLENIEKKMTKK